MLIPDIKDWSLLGAMAMEIEDDNQIYVVGFGYSYYNKGLYVRVWYQGNFIGGSWVDDMESQHRRATLKGTLPPTLIEKCVAYAKRFENMKVFS